MPNATRLLLLLLLTLTGNVSIANEVLRFAALGDIPYGNNAREKMPGWLKKIGDTQPAFLIHIGDFKDSDEQCSDTLFLDRLNLFNQSTQPFIYTPGDNEWSDCDRLDAGGFNPEERLEKLRELFFQQPLSLGQQRLPLETQSDAPEHVRWEKDNIVFLTVNLPASNNYGTRRTPSKEFLTRNPKVINWMREGFATAREHQAKAIVIGFQANPGFALHARGVRNANFSELLDMLQQETLAFGRPVLIIHGDTHMYQFDQPMRDPRSGETLANFWRVEVPGAPFRGWVEISISLTSHETTPASIKATQHKLH